MPKPKYHTPVNGMIGTGKAAAADMAQPADREQNPAKLTGGTFSGLQVTEDIKKQIEKSNASPYLYFTESEDEPGTYDMHTKLPEYGCGGEGKPVYHLRKNMNRLMKHAAQKFLGMDGKPDIDQGMKFVSEMYQRFGWSGGCFSKEHPLEKDREILREDATNWLCRELEIPVQDREDFKNFSNDMISMLNEHAAIMDNTFYMMWHNFCKNLMALQAMQKMEDSPFRGTVPGGNGKGLAQSNVDAYERSVQELQQIAAIDPETEMKMIVPNECIGSKNFVINISKRVNNANRVMGIGGSEIPEKGFFVRFGDYHREQTDWPEHHAGTIGTFTTGEGEQKKTWYLTAESFAAVDKAVVGHPGVTNEVSLGIYSGKEDFSDYYGKDNSSVHHYTEEEKQFVRILNEKMQDATNELCDLYGVQMSSGRNEQKSATPFYTAYQEEKRKQQPKDADEMFDFIRNLLKRRDKVPAEHGKAFDRMLRLCDDVRMRHAGAAEEMQIYQTLRTKWQEEIDRHENLAGFISLDEEGGSVDHDAVTAKKKRELQWLNRIIDEKEKTAAQTGPELQAWEQILNAVTEGRGFDRLPEPLQKHLKDNGIEENAFESFISASAIRIRTQIDEELFAQMSSLSDWMERAENGKMPPKDQKDELADIKYTLGLDLIEKMTGVKIPKEPGEEDLKRLTEALGQFCINGVPYTYLLEEGITDKNCREAVSGLAQKMCDYFRPEMRSKSNEVPGILKNGRLQPLTYVPPVLSEAEINKLPENAREEVSAQLGIRAEEWRKLNEEAAEYNRVYDRMRRQTTEVSVQIAAGDGEKTVKRSITMAEYYERETEKRIPREPVKQEKTAPQPSMQLEAIHTNSISFSAEPVPVHTNSIRFSAEPAPKKQEEKKENGVPDQRRRRIELEDLKDQKSPENPGKRKRSASVALTEKQGQNNNTEEEIRRTHTKKGI